MDLIGREPERAAISAWLASPAPPVLLIEGRAGIGKTTLWRAGVEEARVHGWRILSCTAAAAEAQLAFTTLRDLLELPFDEIADGLPVPQRRALAVLLLREDVDGAPPDPGAIAVAFLRALHALAEQEPTLLAVDDLQWVDDASAAPLTYALRRVRSESLAVLLARRLEADIGAPLEPDGHSEEYVRTLAVGGVSMGAVSRILRDRLGSTLPRPTLHKVYETSAGNPLYAIELARSLLDSKAVLRPGDPLPVPETLHELIRGRLFSLPSETLETLVVASALSRPTLAMLGEALGSDPLPALLAALDAHVVEVSASGDVRFAHPLFAASVSGLFPDRRAELHARLAEVVSDREERAHHLALATTGPDESVARAIEDAATEVQRRGARSVAAELFQAAARLTPVEDEHERGRRLLAAAWSLWEAGDTESSEQLLGQLVEELPEGDLRCEARWRLGTILTETTRWPEAMTLWRAGLEGTTETWLRAEIGRAMAVATIFTSTADEATHFARDAVDAAELSGDRRLLAYALAARALVAVLSGDDEAHPAIERALELERGLDESPGVWSPTAVAAEGARHLGHVESSRFHYAAVLDGAVQSGDAELEQWAAFGLASADLLAGDYARADRMADVVAEITEQTGVMQIPSRTLRAYVDAHQGRLGPAHDLLSTAHAMAEAEDNRMHLYGVSVVQGFVSTCENDSGAAAAHYGRAHALAADLGAGHATAMRAFLHEAEAAASAGLSAQADAALAAFDRATGSSAPAWAAVIRGRAAAARLVADAELVEAETGLEDALAEDDGSMPLERGRTLLLLGSVRRRLRHRKAARETLQEALEIFEGIGAEPWAAQTSAELGRIGGRAPSPGGLTPTEQRVADVVAEGKSNKEVAAELVVSVHTVEAALTSIYRKLDVRSRTELARKLSDAAASKQ